uniref:Ankyrin repeat domain-containing protein n=1 Tax=Chrysotila carterae TaxID=13221 RepID=A0A7S4EXR6_CHRCT
MLQAVDALLEQDSSLVNEITTGGATPLHMCGMSRSGQLMTAHLIAKGADIEAVDTYGFRPLHRIASNNLAIGAKALIAAGADVNARASGATPLRVAMESRATDVIKVLQQHGASK